MNQQDNDKLYIVISNLPIEQQEPFKRWLEGQTCPNIEEEGGNQFNCAYIWDYKNWLQFWEKGEDEPVWD